MGTASEDSGAIGAADNDVNPFGFTGGHQSLERQFVIDRNGNLQRTQPAPFPKDEYAREVARSEELKQSAIERAGHMFTFPIMKTR